MVARPKLAQKLGESMLEALSSLVEERAMQRPAPRRTLWTWNELAAQDYPVRHWRYLRKKHAREFERSGAVIAGSPNLIDPVLFEKVIRALASGAPLPAANDAH